MPTVVGALLVALSTIAIASAANCTIPEGGKVDCGFSGINQQQCEAKGCCWKPVNPNPNNDPWCFENKAAPSPVPPKPGTGTFTADEIATMTKFFLANIDIQGDGGVVAAPDTGTKGGSYYFHWMRDGAITMDAVQKVIGADHPSVGHYVKWVQHAQSLTSPNNIDIRGEPKFNLPNGGPFTGGWCRPQNDGAGLRAKALGRYANHLLATGKDSVVKSTIWPLMHNDCDYVAKVWTQFDQTCDLWEEIRGNLFFTLMVQRKGLRVCSRLASTLKNATLASYYDKVASDIQSTAEAHWNGQFITEASNRPKDSATILGLLYGADDGDDIWAMTDAKVSATVNVLNGVFQRMFPLNAKDDAAGIPGVLWGRYEGDSYAGGNPWILNTGGAADVYYRQAKALKANALKGELPKQADFDGMVSLVGGVEKFGSSEVTAESVDRLAGQLASIGDGILARIRHHVSALGFHLPEQIDKETGDFANAHDLTWSYGSVLLAIKSGAEYRELASL